MYISRFIEDGVILDLYPCAFSQPNTFVNAGNSHCETLTLSIVQSSMLKQGLAALKSEITTPRLANESNSLIIGIDAFLRYVDNTKLIPSIALNHIKMWQKRGAQGLCFTRVFLSE